MPKKDGTPTAAERRDAERIAANHQWIAEAADDILADMRSTMDDADEWAALIDAEQARRIERRRNEIREQASTKGHGSLAR